MNTPRFLVFGALLFWGWQTGHMVLGAVAGAALESSRFIRARWSLTQADFNRLWNVCTVLFLGAGMFLLINEGTISLNDFFVNAGRRPEAIRQAGKSALVWFQWFPILFLPFLLAQAFNEEPRVGLAAFSWWLRRQEARNPKSTLPREGINVAFPYLALCLLAASATTERKEFFYAGNVVLIGWALGAVRTRRYPLVAWSLCFAVVAVAGYGGHIGLFRLQKQLEEMNVAWFTRFSALGFSHKETRTRLGTIGELKNSDRIVLRLRTDGSAPPELLREASFSTYHAPFWNNPNLKRDFGPAFPENDNTTWKLLPRKHSRRQVSIAQFLRGGNGLLALPSGSSTLTELPAVTLQTNSFGVTRAGGAPGLVIFNAFYDRGTTIDSPAAPEDQIVIDEMEPAVGQVAKELRLQRGMETKEAMRLVAKYFDDKFHYASYLTTAHAETSNETALARFLLHTHSGHCEYFATATTLLLRQAGVPTRYAVGYSVQEGSGKKYVVRERHAHAWTLVWNGTSWIDFDTTPGAWYAEESAHMSWLQPIKDFFSDAWFQFSKFRWGKTEWRKYFMWAPLPLLIIVLMRFLGGKQWRRVRARREVTARERQMPGADSDFYFIEKHFAARGLERRASENWSAWFRRIAEYEKSVAQLDRVLLLHYRHRFDPLGLKTVERDELRSDVLSWLSNQRSRPV